MVGRSRMVRLDPGDLGFERGDPLEQLILRIGVESFLRQQAGGVAARAREVLCVHCAAESPRTPVAVNKGGR